MEKAGLENAGTSCVWVAKCNIINVRGHGDTDAVVDCRVSDSVRYCTNVVNIIVSFFLFGLRVLITPCDLIVLY